MRGVGFAPDITLSWLAKKLRFSLIWPEYLLPYVWGVCLLANIKHVCLFFSLSNGFSFWPLFRKAQLCGVYGLKWTYGQILQSPLWCFAAPSWLSLVSLLSLWLMPSLPGLWVSGGGPHLARLLWCHILSIFLNDGFNGALWDVQSFLLHNFVPDLFGELLGLHGAPCLAVPLA